MDEHVLPVSGHEAQLLRYLKSAKQERVDRKIYIKAIASDAPSNAMYLDVKLCNDADSAERLRAAAQAVLDNARGRGDAQAS